MSIIFKNWVKKFCLLILFCFSSISQAQIQEKEYSSFVPKPLTSFTTGTVQDSEYNLPNQKNIETYCYFSLAIDNNKAPYTAYSVTANFQITPYDQARNPLLAEMVTKSMTVNYINSFSSVGANFSDFNYFKIKNKFGILVTLDPSSIVVKNSAGVPITPTTAYTDNVTVSMGFKAKRYYPLATTLISPTATPNTAATAVTIGWGALAGAVEYELEWTWVDNYNAASSTAITAPQDILFTDRNFDLNNTRIVVKANPTANAYEIPQIYSRGYLLYRIRGIGRNPANENAKVFGNWSSGTTAKVTVADWLHKITIAEHESTKNWQFQASYAEDGKKKEVVSYFDGSLRNRQTVTKINTSNTAVVGEVIYDTQGRPAIEVLPTPTADNTIHYYPNYNLFNPTTKYSNKNFDYDSNACVTNTASMDNTVSGSSKYYSSNNTFTSSINRNFIPDAKLYPFSQIEYTPDNTGRISRKGGVGNQHQLGSNHEMKYFYATPIDLELNRLFGYKVGDVSHYKKNTVIDPNGQISVSYLDPQGRTIATALAGENPLNLEGLLDETPASSDLISNLIKSNTSKSTGLFYNNMDMKSINKQITSAENNLKYEFNYTLNQTNSFKPECQTPAFSYPFVYDLEISLKDNCGEEQLVTLIDEAVGTEKLDGIAKAASVTKTKFVSKLLLAGSYSLVKELKVNEKTLNRYVAHYMGKITTKGSTCYEDPDKYKVDASLPVTSCDFSCASCTAALGTKAVYVQNAFNAFYSSTKITATGTTMITVLLNGATNIDNTAIDPIELNGLNTRFSKEWELLKAECDKSCLPSAEVFTPSCAVNEQMLYSDVSPNGQYGATIENIVNPDNTTMPNPLYRVSVFNNISTESTTGNKLFYNNTTTGNNWKKPIEDYKDEDDVVSWIDVETIDNESTFSPKIDRPWNSIPLSGNDKITNPDGKTFSYKVKPQYLANSKDFIANWNDGWAKSLVKYHPEYIYLEYSNKLCGILKSGITSDDYDSRIQNTETFADAVSKGYIDAAGTGILIYSNDPYFQPLGAIETTTLPALRYNTGTSSIMYQALRSNYSGSLTLFKNAMNVVLCSPITTCTSTFSSASVTQKDAIWNVYKAMYLGLKANIQHIYMNLYAMEKKTYNGCIGIPTSKNLGDVLGSAFTTQKTAINTAIQGMSTAGTLCASTSAPLYEKLEKRFIPADFGYDSSIDPNVAVANLKAVNNYQVYAQTGNCPLLSDLDLFLNSFFKDPSPHVFTTTNATYTPFSKQYLSSNLLISLSPGVTIPTAALTLNTTSTGTKLEFKFNASGIPSGVTSLTTPSYKWYDYGTAWKIIGLKQFFYDKVISTPGSGIFSFKVIAEISNGANNTKSGEILLTGTTAAKIGECGVVGSGGIGEVLNPNATIYSQNNSQNVCDKQTKFSDAIAVFLTQLVNNYALNSTTPISLSSYTSYRDTFLEEFFGADPSTVWVKDLNVAQNIFYIKKGNAIVATLDFEENPPSTLISNIIGGGTFSNFIFMSHLGHFTVNYNGQLYTFPGVMTFPGYSLSCPTSPTSPTSPTLVQKCIPQPVSPVACENAKKTEYIEFINGKSGVPAALSNYGIDPATVQFCENNYQYIFESYRTYITEMKRIGLTSAYDIRFRTISEFGNTYLNYGFAAIGTAIAKYSEYYVLNATSPDLLNWNNWVNTEFRKTNTLCPPAPISNNYSMPYPPDDEIACEHFYLNVDGSFGNDIYNSVIEAKRQKFIKDYITQAMAATETFDMTYKDKEYQYTLYYYDQAGNLTQTIAPEGVKRMALTAAINDNINNYRIANNPVENTSYQPAHTFKTQYRYNSLNQLVWQKTPDGGETRFAYDKLGRIIASQNAKQAKPISGTVKLSYTSYDGLGRIIEAGEVLNPNGSVATTYTINNEGKLVYGGTAIVDAFTMNVASRTEVTRTVYSDDPDVDIWSPYSPPGGGTPPVITRSASFFFSDKTTTPTYNNVNRVTAIFYYDTYMAASPLSFNNAILYNYDIHGNVKEVVNYYPGLKDAGCVLSSKNDCEAYIKRIVYDYDLISGNVNTVTFQPNKPDLFIHKYNYDADNRIVDVQTSSDNVVWEKEANYQYYLHGPLARAELGNKKVQGIDYAYTLQGWLKAVNGENLAAAANDIGQDGLTAGSTKTFDAFGYSLNYYDKDYKSIGTTDETKAFKPLMYSRDTAIEPSTRDLYNGNIKQMTTAIRKRDGSLLNIQKNSYTYDQLNRLKIMTSSAIVPNAATGTTSYDSNYSYDRNGNLLTLNRKAPNSSGTPIDMDKLTYDYPNESGKTYRNNNKLALVKDATPASATFNGDIDDQVAKLAALIPPVVYNIDMPATHNYIYDEIGQLIEDKSEGLKINWRVDGKVKNIVKGTTTYYFEYDGLGNRIAKKEVKPGITTSTYYVRDAQGNELGVYRYDVPSSNIKTLTLTEHHIFGSSRLGLESKSLLVYISSNTSTFQEPVQTNFLSLIGDKRFELSNHLGNVLAVISDKKIPTATAGVFNPDVLSYSDYYPFGMLVPNRHGTSIPDGHRYGFQGQEMDNEIKGEGNSLNYTFRMHDPRIGRFFAPDPLEKKYPNYTPYSFSGNKVINSVEIEGLEDSFYMLGKKEYKGETYFELVNVLEIGGNVELITGTKMKTATADRAYVYGSDGHWHAMSDKLRGTSLNNLGNGREIFKQLNKGDNADAQYEMASKLKSLESIGNTASAAIGLAYLGQALKDIKGIKSIIRAFKREESSVTTGIAGSGRVAGVLEVSSEVKSVKQFNNYKPKNAIEFVFDPKTETFVVGKVKNSVPGLSPHQNLAKSINADNNVVGGMFKRSPTGEILTNEASGHYYKNWTPEIRAKFENFLESHTGQQVKHTAAPSF
nr:polymorphic toxin type 43 domain-containing protein [uncultured Flavobacterium sp.]